MIPTPESIAERQREVARLTRQGWNARQIADRVGVTARTVCRDRVATGVAQPRAPLFTDDEHRRALAMITDGASINEVARTMNRNVDTIWRRFKGMGWTSDQTGQYNSLRSKLGRLLDE